MQRVKDYLTERWINFSKSVRNSVGIIGMASNKEEPQKKYQVLIVEDQPADAELIEIYLGKAHRNIQTHLVQSKSELKKALNEGCADLVICDYDLGSFTGADVLKLVKNYSKNLPFIMISGYLGEKKAIEIMTSGADDFVFKDELDRLCPVVKRELKNYRNRLQAEHQRDKAIHDLQERIKEQKCLYEISHIDEQNLSIEDFLAKVVENIPQGWQYPLFTEAVIEYAGQRYPTKNYSDSPWSLTVTNNSITGGPLAIRVVYLEEKRKIDIDPFLKEERVLFHSILDILSLKINRILDQRALEHKEELLERTNVLANIGTWEADLVTGKMIWSPQVYDIHEVDQNYQPTLEGGINFYKEGDHREKIREVFTKAVEEGQPYDAELIIVTAKGNECWVRTIGEPEFKRGKCVRVYGSFQNINRRKKSEIELQVTEKKLRDIFEHSTNLFYRHDIDGRLTYVSPQSEHFLGCSPEESVHSWAVFLTDHPVNKEGNELTRRAIETGMPQPSYKLQMRKIDGEIIWVRVNEAPVVENGKTVGIVGSLTDITELVYAQEEQQMLAKLARETPNMVIITDTDHHIEWVNQAFERVTGYHFEEIKGKTPDFLSGPGTVSETEIYIRDHLKDELEKNGFFTAEQLHYSRNGDPIWVEITFSSMTDDSGNIVKYFSIHKNINERKDYLARLKNKQERLEEAQRLGKIGDWDYDVQTGEIIWSDEIFSIYERDPELGPPGYKELYNYYPVDGDKHAEAVRKAVNGIEDYNLDLRIRTGKGKEKFVHHRGFSRKDDTGKVISLHGVVQDITDRKEKELEIITKQNQLKAVSDNVEALLFRYLLNPDGTDQLIFISESIERMFEVTADDALNSTDVIWKHILKEDDQRVRNSVQKSAETLEKWDCQFRIQTPSGKFKSVHGIGNPAKLENGSIQWDTILLDVTEQVHRERMNEILIQEIHHRVKNNLAVIISLLDLQLQDLDEKSLERSTLEQVITRIFTIAQVHKLLFEGSDLIDINVKDYVNSLVKYIMETMKVNDLVEVDLQTEDLLMNVNELTPLGMLLNELLTNSVKYAFKKVGKGAIKIHVSFVAGRYKVLYMDNGPGISESQFKSAQSSGFRIVKVLLEQLEAEYKLITDRGFGIEFIFSERKKGAHGNVEISVI